MKNLKISNKLLKKLCCPVCKGELIEESNQLQCNSCGKQYLIINDIPVFLNGKTPYDNLYSQINFNKSPFGYDEEYSTWRKGQINREIVKYLKAGSVLDDGGGYGFLKEFLSKKRNTYYNMDYSYEILSYDTSKLKCVGKGEELPFKDVSFDNVVGGDVLEHVQDKIKYLEETYRVLKPGGVFILNTPRTGWLDSYKKSIWFWIPYLSYAWGGIRNRLPENKINPQNKTPEGVVDTPSDEKWLRNQLKDIGYKIIVQTRTDNHPFGFTHKFWRKFADMFIDSKSLGHCVFFVCKKLQK